MAGAIVNLNSLTRHLGDWRAAGTEDVAYRSLADALKGLVLDGRLPLDARLPGERRLAEGLGVSRITISAALDRLRADGFLTSRVGSGTFTALPFSRAERLEGLFHVAPGPEVMNMATAVLPAGAPVHAAYARALESLPPHLPGHGYDPIGLLPLRRAVAEAYVREGLATGPQQIVVTAGAQNGLGILLRAFARPGEAVVIDHPTYPHAIEAIVRAGLRPVPVALTAAGWDIDGLIGTIRRIRPRLVYLLGAHQNPTGHVLSAEDEATVARTVADVGSLLVLDDTQRELWFDQAPPPPAAPGPHVVRLGSMSKTWWGGLRIGWIRADVDVADAVVRARASMDLGTAVIEQLPPPTCWPEIRRPSSSVAAPSPRGKPPCPTACERGCRRGRRRDPRAACHSGSPCPARSQRIWWSRRRPTASSWPPAPGSAWTEPFSVSSACRTACRRRSWKRPSTASPKPGPNWTVVRPGAPRRRNRICSEPQAPTVSRNG
ncbi:MAG: PLP-dependent aminotransferase family protein [Caulobacteraceae bacterium]|nr:PLP-dependent aminotransferase family protein [Caulobacteraceae bacterium]